MTLPKKVTIVEVGPRDGLQNEKQSISVADRVEFVDQLAQSGLCVIETGSFVSPKWVPQMANTAEVFQRITQHQHIRYPALVPNMKGLQAAIEAGVQEIAVFAAASESFSHKNINCSIAESLERFRPVCEQALHLGLAVRGYISCVLGCPYEGEIAVGQVAEIAGQLSQLGCHEISLGDTIGIGTPMKAKKLLSTVAENVPMEKLAIHFHDTYGQALANILACLELGVATIDSSVAGLGGCPYAKGASGNVATEDVIYMLNGMGIETGVDLNQVVSSAWWISNKLDRTPTSSVAMAFGIQ